MSASPFFVIEPQDSGRLAVYFSPTLKKMTSELQAACASVMQRPSEANLISLLDLWSADWKQKGRTRAIGPGSYDIYCTLGLYAFAGNAPRLSKASIAEEACAALNHFLRDRFPNGKWTSLAVILNPRIGLHRDMGNMIGMLNHAIAVGDFTGGRVWIEDDEGTSPDEIVMKNKIHRLRGSWFNMHDNPVSFNARRYHKVEPHEGHMWAIAAYTLTAFRRCSDEKKRELTSLGFPLPDANGASANLVAETLRH